MLVPNDDTPASTRHQVSHSEYKTVYLAPWLVSLVLLSSYLLDRQTVYPASWLVTIVLVLSNLCDRQTVYFASWLVTLMVLSLFFQTYLRVCANRMGRSGKKVFFDSHGILVNCLNVQLIHFFIHSPIYSFNPSIHPSIHIINSFIIFLFIHSMH